MKTGYVSGVFDLLHAGHVRFLARCRARCDRLIVGVLDDHWVEAYKRTPIIPADQRVEVVGALRVVNMSLRSGPTRTLTRAFYEAHGITVQFIGVDHRESEQFRVARELITLEVVDSESSIRTSEILRRVQRRASQREHA